MMRLILILSVITALVSCSADSVQPVAYNDTLAVQQIRITEKANKLQDAFAGYVRGEMEIRRNELENQLEKAEEQVGKMQAFKNDESLLKAAKDLIKGYKELNAGEYDEAIKILSKPDSVYTEVDEARLTILYKSIDEKSNRLISEFLQAQKTFAGNNNLELKPANEESASN